MKAKRMGQTNRSFKELSKMPKSASSSESESSISSDSSMSES